MLAVDGSGGGGRCAFWVGVSARLGDLVPFPAGEPFWCRLTPFDLGDSDPFGGLLGGAVLGSGSALAVATRLSEAGGLFEAPLDAVPFFIFRSDIMTTGGDLICAGLMFNWVVSLQ